MAKQLRNWTDEDVLVKADRDAKDWENTFPNGDMCLGRDGKSEIRNGVRHDDTTMKTPKEGRAIALRISAWGCKSMVEAW